MKKICTLIFILLTLKLSAGDDDFCGIRNTTFQAGENITYHIYYTLAGVYVMGGEASFTTSIEQLNGKIVYHIIGQGKTNSFFDGFFKVRDKYESYIDTTTMQPLKFVRNVQEDQYKKKEIITFNHDAGTATSGDGVYKTSNCVQDAISSVYYARNINFDKYKVNDKIPFDLFIDNETFHLYIRYLGKEKVKTRFGKFNAIKFKPLVIQGNTFKGGENMTVWITNDANRLPIRIESGISVGSVKIDMMSYRNLRYPLSSLISF